MSPPLQEPDQVASGPIVWIAALALATGLVTVGVSAWILHARRAAEAPPDPVAPQVGGLVERPFAEPSPPPFAADELALHAYAWVDRDAGVVRVPVDVAMRLVVEGRRP